MFMKCIDCGNCKTDDPAYFCPMKNEFVVNEKVKTAVVEKTRSGWKKGQPGYEIHRRKLKKQEEQI